MGLDNQPLVSIAMCTYNGEEFIKEQLDSILNQSHKNIELIITDDGSKDKTIDIINSYIEIDDRIKLFQNKENLGFIKNFEKAISLCNGEYIALADQDDIWKKEKISIFLQEIKDNILIYSDAIIINRDSTLTNKRLIEPNGHLIKGKCNKAFLFYNCVSGNTLMFKKELTTYILPIPKTISYHDIWIAFVASTISTITYAQEPMTYYRRYEEQITATTKREYKSIYDRWKQKEMANIKFAKDSVINNDIFLKLLFLDNEAKELLVLLNNHYKTFENGYFNMELYNYLKENRDDVFAIKAMPKRDKYVRKIAMKLKLHKLTLFST